MSDGLRHDLTKVVAYIKHHQDRVPGAECVDLLESWVRTYAADQLRAAAGRMADPIDALQLEQFADAQEIRLGADVRALEAALREDDQ